MSDEYDDEIDEDEDSGDEDDEDEDEDDEDSDDEAATKTKTESLDHLRGHPGDGPDAVTAGHRDTGSLVQEKP